MGTRFALASLCFALWTAASATAQSAGLDEDMRAANGWVRARLRASHEGHADLVVVPVVFASEGWGCTCPGNYIGDSPDEGAGPAWVELRLTPGVTLPTVGARGAVMMLEGYLSGNASSYEGDGGTHYVVRELVVTRLVARRVGADPHMRVVRRGAFDCTSTVTDTTPLHVHERRGVRATVIGELTPGTRVTIGRDAESWVTLSSPIAGWVSAYAVTTTCVPAP